MILRLKLLEAAYDNGVPTLCLPTTELDLENVSGNISINGGCNMSFTDLESGVFTHIPFPCVAGEATVTDISLENTLYVTIDIDVPNLWTPTDVQITLNKVGYLPLVRNFVIFGYDIGRDPNVVITAINPELYLVMIPATYPDAFASTGSVPATTGVWDTQAGFGEAVTINADFPGVIGNSISIVGTGSAYLSALINTWNIANPQNTASFIETNGTGYKPALGETYVLTGGTNLPIQNVAYANFVGLRKPFTNDLYLHANYSNLQDNVEYRDLEDNILAETHIAVLPCYSGSAIKLISTVFDVVGCTYVEVDTCVFGDLTFEGLSLIPAFSCGITCDSCCTDDCLVTLNDNYAQFVIDTDAITPLNVDDAEAISTEEVTITATVYNACGNFLNDDSAVVSLNPVPALSVLQIPITFPEEGDYIVHCEMSSGAFSCKKVESFKGCNFYKVVKEDCSNHRISNLSLDPITISVESLNDDKQWDEFLADTIIESCEDYLIETTTDGIYRITINGVEYRVFVRDCDMKQCFVDFTKARVCEPKADCACGGNCGGLCVTVPKDLYDFNAFSILTYNYMALLNDLYIKNFIFTVFQPSDIDRLFTMQQYLLRIKEYCGECSTTSVTTNASSCGCTK